MDVDGSYLYRKWQKLHHEGITVAPLRLPSVPLAGWEIVDAANYLDMAKRIPRVTRYEKFSVCTLCYLAISNFCRVAITHI